MGLSNLASPLIRNIGYSDADTLYVEEGEYFTVMAPQITGYTFIVFEGIPKVLSNLIFGEQISSLSLGTIAQGFTLPQLSISEKIWDGYIPVVQPGKLSMGNDLSVKFIDDEELKLTNFLQLWFSTIRPFDKTSYELHKQMSIPPNGGNSPDYKLGYYANAIIFSTDPGMNIVNNAIACMDIWPSAFPTDILSTEISSNSLYTFTQNFKVGYVKAPVFLKQYVQDTYLTKYQIAENFD